MARDEKIKSELGQRLRNVREHFGDPDRDAFCLRLGISKGSLGNYERGDRVPDSTVLQSYRVELGVDANWLLTGEGLMFADLGAASDKAFVSLPFLDVEASAGLGTAVPVHEGVQSVVSFERAFLRSMGAMPDHCKIITARGDSMTPTIPDGSLIVIDHSQRDVVNGWISVVNVCGDLLVKRVRRRLDGTIELVSDNPIYPVEAVGADRADQLIVIGRVVYFCRAP